MLPSGKHTKNYGTSPFSIGNSTIIHYKSSFSIATLNYQRVYLTFFRTGAMKPAPPGTAGHRRTLAFALGGALGATPGAM